MQQLITRHDTRMRFSFTMLAIFDGLCGTSTHAAIFKPDTC
jgi:hypothetical protein